MLLSTIELFILLEFRSKKIVKLDNKSRHVSAIRRFEHGSRTTGLTFVVNTAYSGREIEHSALLQVLAEKRKLNRSIMFAALCGLCDSGYLTFYVKNKKISPTQRTFVLTVKGSRALNDAIIFKKAFKPETKDW